MAFTKITSTNISDYAIDTQQLSNTATAAFAKTLAPKILYANVASDTYTILDDTAVNVGGGYIVVTGAEFQSGAQVLIDTTLASSVTYVNSTTLRAEIPAKSAASYNLYVVNPDGGTGIKPAGITYSSEPSWVTASPLDNQLANTAFGVNLSANSATSYSVAAGSTLPAGTTLAANGYFSGTVSIVTQTTYSFNVVATDAENQDSSKTFQVTVTIEPPDPYFNYTTLLLQADGVSNNATNSSFVDSSNNSLTVTPSGTPIQGSQNPFGTGNWSNYFDGNGDYLQIANNSGFDFGTGDFTVEAWVYQTTLTGGGGVSTNGSSIFGTFPASGTITGWSFAVDNAGKLLLDTWVGGTEQSITSTSSVISPNQWNHVAVTNSSGTYRLFVNGTSVAFTGSISQAVNTGGNTIKIGALLFNNSYYNYLTGYISNARVIKGTALYTSTFTPSTTPLTAIANTQLLTCQANQFKDSSNNAFTVTPAGNSTVERFNPFGTNAIAYSINTDAGSTYFNGSTDYLTLGSAIALTNFTIETWFNLSSAQSDYQMICGGSLSNTGTYLTVKATGLEVQFGTNAGTSSTISYTFNVGTWYHLAVVRNSGTVVVYVNGVSISTSNSSQANQFNVNYIGVGYSTSYPFLGYLSNFRIVNTALYTSNFTPSTTPLTAVANTQLLLLSKNAGIYDATMQNNIRTIGDAKVRTNVFKYGTGSIHFDGTGDILSVPHTNSIDLSSGDFTIETWVYWNSYVAGSAVIAKGTGPYVAYLIYVGDASGGTEVDFYTSISGSGWSVSGLNFTINPTLGVWHHLAVTRSGNVYRTFFNGTLANSVTQAGTLVSQSAAPPLIMGKYNVGNTFNGYIDDLRITKGYARYTANFTAPTTVLPKK